MSDELARIQRLLVIQLDTSVVVKAAIAAIQQDQPMRSLIRLKVLEDSGSSLRYVIEGEVPFTIHDNTQQATIQWLRAQQVDAAILFTARGRSPYAWAYRCYLAGIPIRMGQSQEFGGQVLSHCLPPPSTDVSDPHLYLVQTCGLIPTASPFVQAEIPRSPIF